jgi:16S rRNA (guanine527-N7)-methyltransferase
MAQKGKRDLSNDEISYILSPFRVQLSAAQVSKIREYISVLLKWNKLVSLTTVVDPAEIVARHFGESMFLSAILPVENCRLADVGSGAGFPGLALKILCRDLEIILIEANKKKAAFLSEIVRSLDLRGVEVIPARFEDIRPEESSTHIITARALGGFPSLLQWSRRSLSDCGHVALWVGGEDMTKISNTSGWIWHPAVRIPDSQRRFILIGRPNPVV